jgi:hypothetical protein
MCALLSFTVNISFIPIANVKRCSSEKKFKSELLNSIFNEIINLFFRINRKDRQLRERDIRLRRREKLKLARLQRRLRRKEQNRRRQRKQKLRRKKDSCSVDSEKLNCFTHNNEHWKTAPLWTGTTSTMDRDARNSSLMAGQKYFCHGPK